MSGLREQCQWLLEYVILSIYTVPPPPILGVQRHCPGPWELVWQNDLHGRGWVISQYEVMRTSNIGQTELFQIAVVEQNRTFYSLTMDDLDVDGEYNFTVRGFTVDGPGNVSVAMRYQPERPNTPNTCLLYTSPSPRDRQKSRMPSSA